jgi:hypothetical protein
MSPVSVRRCHVCGRDYRSGEYAEHSVDAGHRAARGGGTAPRRADHGDVMAYVRSGASFQMAAERFGLSRERVRQIAKREGVIGAERRRIVRRKRTCPHCRIKTVHGEVRHRISCPNFVPHPVSYEAYRERDAAIVAEVRRLGGLDSETAARLAARYGISVVTVRAAAQRGGYRPHTRPIGERARDARILTLSRAGWSRRLIAREVGCSTTTVFRTLRMAREAGLGVNPLA